MKEVDWGVIHGEGTVVCTCDQCGNEASFDFEDGHPDYSNIQGELHDLGWTSAKVNGSWMDFCSESCRNKYIKNNT